MDNQHDIGIPGYPSGSADQLQNPQADQPVSPSRDQELDSPQMPIELVSVEEHDYLFEKYERRSIQEIQEHRRLEQLESEAAHAASIILEDAELPTFDSSHQEYVDDKARLESLAHAKRQTRVQSKLHRQLKHQSKLHRPRNSSVNRLAQRALIQTTSPGAQIVYILITTAALGGLIGLAASLNSAIMLLVAGIITPILLPICVWRWIRWLDSAPYYYRLMTSLGEDARNLVGTRLFWWSKKQ